MRNQQFNHVAPSGLQVYIIYVLPVPRQKKLVLVEEGGSVCTLCGLLVQGGGGGRGGGGGGGEEGRWQWQ